MKDVLNINYFVDSNICEKMISFFYKYLDTKELNVNDMYDGRTINLFNCSAESHELNCFNEIINSIKKEMCRKYDLKDLFLEYAGMCKWEAGQYLNLHGDNAYYPSGEPNYVPHRDYSSIVYLNDNFLGGNFYFKDNTHYSIKTGMLMGFPSGVEYAHGIKKVLRGNRYTLAIWWTLNEKYKVDSGEIKWQ